MTKSIERQEKVLNLKATNKLIMRNILSLCIQPLFSDAAISQQVVLDYSKLVLPSPKGSRLSKFVVVPVSYYTGISDITIHNTLENF